MDPRNSSTEFNFTHPAPNWNAETQEASSGHPQNEVHAVQRPWEDFMTWDTAQTSANHYETEDQPLAFHSHATGVSFSVASSSYDNLAMDFSPIQSNTNNAFPFPASTMDQISPASGTSPHGLSQSHWRGKEPISAAHSPPISRKHSGQPDSASMDSPDVASEAQLEQTFASKNARKRKSIAMEDDSPELSDSKDNDQDPPKKSHNMIEKRYRTNINDKIKALRDTVPSLRVMSRGNSNAEEVDLEGLAPAHKLNKANILAKATEYIKHLQKQKNKMEQEILDLKARVEQFEKMIRAGTFPVPTPLATPEGLPYQDGMFPIAASSSANITGVAAPEGMIPVPENFAMLRRTQMGHPPYSTVFTAYPQMTTQPATAGPVGQPISRRRGSESGRGGKVGRVMLGGLTTLMIADHYFQSQQEDDAVQAKGLMSVPFSFFKLLQPTHSALDYHFPLMSLIRMLLLLCSCIYLVSPIFRRRREPMNKIDKVELAPNYSLAGPIEHRQAAWLTSVQSVWVPRHNFFLEAAALCSKAIKLSMRTLIGHDTYSWITGTTKEQEQVRVKAWRIALDAQLTGGDPEVSLSRLLLTLLASGTLPNTPIQLMLKALHIKVLMREFQSSGIGDWAFVGRLSAALARRYWNMARIVHHACQAMNIGDEDYALPDHLGALLEIDADDVFLNPITQRASNLALNKPITEKADLDPAMDAVVTDIHIASPLDALAAWWSTHLLNKLLVDAIDSHVDKDQNISISDVERVLQTAPPPSTTYLRAVVAQALLVPQNRAANIQTAIEAFPQDTIGLVDFRTNSIPSSPTSICGINSLDELPLPPELSITLNLAHCLDLASDISSSPLESMHDRLLQASAYVNHNLPIHQWADLSSIATGVGSSPFSLLTLVAHLIVIEKCVEVDEIRNDSVVGLERVAAGIRVWVGSKEAEVLLIEESLRAQAVNRCLSVRKTLMGIEREVEEDGDGGYFSMDEEEVPEVGKWKGMEHVNGDMAAWAV
jgi:hypothetical protein